MRVRDHLGAARGDRLQHRRVEIGPRRLAVPVECVEQADMRRDQRRRTDDVAQPLAKFAQAGAVLDLD
jgi:hypothetical protein